LTPELTPPGDQKMNLKPMLTTAVIALGVCVLYKKYGR
jgi:hypothetical protein